MWIARSWPFRHCCGSFPRHLSLLSAAAFLSSMQLSGGLSRIGCAPFGSKMEGVRPTRTCVARPSDAPSNPPMSPPNGSLSCARLLCGSFGMPFSTASRPSSTSAGSRIDEQDPVALAAEIACAAICCLCHSPAPPWRALSPQAAYHDLRVLSLMHLARRRWRSVRFSRPDLHRYRPPRLR